MDLMKPEEVRAAEEAARRADDEGTPEEKQLAGHILKLVKALDFLHAKMAPRLVVQVLNEEHGLSFALAGLLGEELTPEQNKIVYKALVQASEELDDLREELAEADANH